MRSSRWLAATAAVLVLVAAGCGSSDGGGGDASPAKKSAGVQDDKGAALVADEAPAVLALDGLTASGFECTDPEAYVAAPDEISLGADPVSTADCTLGDGILSVVEFESPAAAQVVVNGIQSIACSFGSPVDAIVAGASLVIVSDDSKGDSGGLLAAAADAIGVAVTPADCDKASADDSSDDDTPSGNASTRTNPVPLGEAFNTGDGWTVTVNSFVPDANALVAAGNQFNDPPRDGMVYVSVNVTALYEGRDESRSGYDIGFKVLGSDNKAVGVASQSLDSRFDDSAEVYSGGAITGDVIFEVPLEQIDSIILVAEPSMALSGSKSFHALR